MFEEYSWPRQGDVLFAPADDWHDACVGWSQDQCHGYAEGYKRAAELLVRQVVAEGRDLDYLVYPIGFLYRHALEVLLKRMLHQGGQVKRTGHDLFALWQECRGVIGRLCYATEVADLDAAENVIRQFADKDKESTAFRYPVYLDGRPSFPQSERINLKNLAIVAGRAYAMLNDLSCAITAHLDLNEEL